MRESTELGRRQNTDRGRTELPAEGRGAGEGVRDRGRKPGARVL